MALSSAFRERLEQMDQTRTQRLSLLQAEKELQAKKAKFLASKLERIRSMERRCLLVKQTIANKNFKKSSLKSRIERLDTMYREKLDKLRALKSEVEELEQAEKEKDNFYELKVSEMKDFKETVENFVLQRRHRVEELRNSINEHQSEFMNLQGDLGYTSNDEIAAAEMRKFELLAEKENLDRVMASNYRTKMHLQKQVQNMVRKQK